jgi:hypothetical protein
MTPTQRMRLTFWEQNEAMARMIVGKAGDMTGLMILVADMRDSIGKLLTEALAEVDGKAAEAEAHFRKVEDKGEIPTAIMVLPIEIVRKALEETNPNVSKSLRELPLKAGLTWVAVVVGEGTMLMQAEVLPISSLGELS